MRILHLLPVLCFIFPAPASAHLTGGTGSHTLMVEGKVGDCAVRARTFEIDGIIYTLPKGLTIEDSKGQRLDYQALQPGTRVKIYRLTGERTEKGERRPALIKDGVRASWTPARVVILPPRDDKETGSYPGKIIFEDGVWHN